ncbi:MAG: spiro-SPASM protein [Treponema sp.]|nr:spiro-SPASM protein [Treponema sp.]
MKSIIVFYSEENNIYGDEKVFGEKSARELAYEWAKSFSENIFVIKSSEVENVAQLFEKMAALGKETAADNIIFSYDDLPFLNYSLSKKLLESHEKYKAEYTFSDGYPYGFSPEILACGTVNILCELAKTSQKSEGEKTVSRSCVYNLIKTDINSFEVESLISDKDFRLFRFAFHCGKKDNFLASRQLYKKGAETFGGESFKPSDADVNLLGDLATKDVKILKTVPGFYNIQIIDACSGKCTYCPYPKAFEEKNHINPCESKKMMDKKDFFELVEKISSFSEEAVICLSAWGEAFNHPDLLLFIEKILSKKGLSVFIETDGLLVDENFCLELQKILQRAEPRTNGWDAVVFAVSLDAFSADTYKKIRVVDGFEKAVGAIKMLAAVVPGCVYPQFVRMNENEMELEGFFRFWREKSNASGGKLIIQKYDDFAKLLPECKPADLSPIERNICWHLRRDFIILRNGDVPLCKESLLGGIVGNVFSEDLELIWDRFDSELQNHIEKNYCEQCRKCDESYTFNF